MSLGRESLMTRRPGRDEHDLAVHPRRMNMEVAWRVPVVERRASTGACEPCKDWSGISRNPGLCFERALPVPNLSGCLPGISAWSDRDAPATHPDSCWPGGGQHAAGEGA